MRIFELFENKIFNDKDFVDVTENGRNLNYDLAEDLVYFMNNNDDVYRRHLYPSIASCLDRINKNKSVNSSIFKEAVINSYNEYCKRYPIRELPSSLDEEMCKDICKKVLDELKQHVAEGKYKD